MEKFRVVLNSSTNAFYANSEVHGTVYFETEKKVKAKTITVLIYGRANTSFSSGGGSTITMYSSTQICMKTERLLWKSEDGKNKISAGCYQFPFNFFIPKDALPTLFFFNGDILYYIKALMDVPFGYNRCYFFFLQNMDLNIDSRFQSPGHICSEKKGLTVNVNIQKTEFACGESVPMTVLIENKSSSEVKSIEYGIGIIATCIAKNTPNLDSEANPASAAKTRKISWEKKAENFSKYCFSNVPFSVALNENKEINLEIVIPFVLPSFDHCEIIKLMKYAIFVKVHTRAVFSSGPFASLPVVLEKVPLRQDPAPGIPPSELQIKDSIVIENEQGIHPTNHIKPRYAYFHGCYQTGSPMESLGSDFFEISTYGKPAAINTGFLRAMTKFHSG